MIKFSAQYGDPRSARIFRPIHRCLADIFEEYSLADYTDRVERLDMVLRVSGKIADFGGDGPERLHWRRKAGAASVDVVIPEARWRGGATRDLLQHLDWVVRVSADQLISKLEDERVEGNWDAARRALESAMSAFEGRMPHGGPAATAQLDTAKESKPPKSAEMIKLYKRERGVLKYREAWCESHGAMEHWGTVGKRGRKKAHKIAGACNERALDDILADARKRGYSEIATCDLTRVSVEYNLHSWGGADDVDKRHRLEARLNETLGWTGLGHVDGGSIGSGSMEVLCFVVQADVALEVIRDDLEDTEFSDYVRIRVVE